MNIGGFQKNSLIDFPGQIAAVVFTPGCNFICPYCHNPDLAKGSVAGTSISEQEVLSFLERRRGLLQGVVITGGEPTLQPDLLSFCENLRQMGYSIKLDSNGTRPKVLADLFDRMLVDYLAMDIKTGPAHYHRVMKDKTAIEQVTESIALIMEKAPAYEFRTTCARPLVTEQIMAEIGKMIRGAASYVLQPCSRNVEVLNPAFVKDDRHFFTDAEMESLKAVAASFVDQVRIR